MENNSKSQSSLETISIRFTQNNLPSATLIKNSQDHISLTYTVSLQNISDENISLNHIFYKDNLLSIDKINIEQQSDFQYQDTLEKSDQVYPSPEREVFKKKSILKISNIDFSPFLNGIKQSPTQSSKGKKNNIRFNNSGVFSKSKMSNNQQLGNSRIHSKSKDIFYAKTKDSFAQSIMLKTTKFHSIKEDKVIEPITIRKRASTIRRQVEAISQKTKLPALKPSNYGLCESISVGSRRKALTTHDKMSSSSAYGTLTERMLVGKSCKMGQNDKKAKIYLQKIIQNRNSVMHYNENRYHRFNKEFKQNYEQCF